MKTKIGVSPLLDNEDGEISMKFKAEEKENILQNQFSSVFTMESQGAISTLGKRTNDCIHNLYITEEMVRTEILKINANKSCGPDEINPRMLKELVENITRSITLLLNKTGVR